MSASDDPHAACRERLSALMDGELSEAVLHQACDHWREASESRATWHVYHVIGDVLRSDDLATGACRSAQFVQALRDRLGAEPVMPAPVLMSATATTARGSPIGDGGRRRDPARRWRPPIAIAAGVLAAVGLGSVLRIPTPSGSGGGSAGAGAPRPLTLAADARAGLQPSPPAASATRIEPVVSPVAAASTEPRALAPSDPLIRDARLDLYLQAHQQFAGSSALGVPSGFLRAATTESVAR